MKKLTDLLKEAGIEMGKVYTDKDKPPFKVNEAIAGSNIDKWAKALIDKGLVKKSDSDTKISKALFAYLQKEKRFTVRDFWNWDTNKVSKNIVKSVKKHFKSVKEGLNETKDKIRVQGLGVYDYKSLSKKVGKMVDDLSKRNRKGNHTGLGKRQLSTLAAMWEALSDYEENQ